MDIDIDLLQLRIENGAGHEHRVRGIAARAARILAERVDKTDGHLPANARTAIPATVDLSRMSDERAALAIAAAWLEALTARWETGV